MVMILTISVDIIAQDVSKKDMIDNTVLETALVKNSEEYFKQLKEQYSEVNDTKGANLLRKIANKLSLAAGQGKFTKPILIGRNKNNPNDVNAFVLPGGQMVFTEGLMTLCYSYPTFNRSFL